MLKLRHPKTGATINYEAVSCNPSKPVYPEDFRRYLPGFMREYEIISDTAQQTCLPKHVITPPCGWDKLTLENFEEMMGYRFNIGKDASMRGISREVAFLEFLETKGISRQTKLIEGLTLDNFEEKVGHRFRRTKEDMDRHLSKEQSFEQWKKRMGYT